MSRADTIAQDKWRVQVVRGTDVITALVGTVSHESLFADASAALDYYHSLHIPGSLKRIQVRYSGESRFQLLESEEM